MTTPDNPAVTSAFAFIARAYKELEKNPAFTSREGQHMLSREVAQCLLEDKPLAAEAPTGTGKTVAYMVGALAAAREMSLEGPAKPLVFSTGTKALQAQLISNDLPKLVKAGLIGRHDVVLAKGKGNYFCARGAADLAAQGDVVEEAEVEGDQFVSYASVGPMLDAYDSGMWDGDFDTYLGNRPSSLDRIRVNSETCTGSKCPRYGDCAYFKMRAGLAQAKIIVANHDLVMIDLMRVASDQEPALPVADYLCVFDEGHHLPDKALDIGSTDANLSTLAIELQRLKFFKQEAWKTPALIRLMNSRGIASTEFDGQSAMQVTAELAEALRAEMPEGEMHRRYPKGVIPKELVDHITVARNVLDKLNSRLVEAVVLLQTLAQTEGADGQFAAAEAARPGMKLARALANVLKGMDQFITGERVVKWLFVNERNVALHTCPLDSADVLRPLLWESTRARAVLTSATLRDLDGFNRFKAKLGAPAKTRTIALPYSFDYAKSTLNVPFMKATPKREERKAYMQELSVQLPASINKKEATLVLCASWEMLRDVSAKLKARYGQNEVLVQGEKSIKLLLEAHTKRVDAGKGSILVGVQTMAEGLDLPGKYCTHVAILTLPFAVPTNPVEQEISELLGSRYFMERSLPDAMVRLTQMVGRLLRRESDWGRVTIFDRRIVSTHYGNKMLKALPPFTVVVEKELAAA